MISPALDISNFDVTAFTAFDQVDSQAFIDTIGDVANHNVNIFGITAFVETMKGYFEFGYGYSDDEGILDEFSYHNVTAAFTRRYQPWRLEQRPGDLEHRPGRQRPAADRRRLHTAGRELVDHQAADARWFAISTCGSESTGHRDCASRRADC